MGILGQLLGLPLLLDTLIYGAMRAIRLIGRSLLYYKAIYMDVGLVRANSDIRQAVI